LIAPVCELATLPLFILMPLRVPAELAETLVPYKVSVPLLV